MQIIPRSRNINFSWFLIKQLSKIDFKRAVYGAPVLPFQKGTTASIATMFGVYRWDYFLNSQTPLYGAPLQGMLVWPQVAQLDTSSSPKPQKEWWWCGHPVHNDLSSTKGFTKGSLRGIQGARRPAFWHRFLIVFIGFSSLFEVLPHETLVFPYFSIVVIFLDLRFCFFDELLRFFDF